METVTITIKKEELHVMDKALSALPYYEVFNLINRINNQLAEQNKQNGQD